MDDPRGRWPQGHGAASPPERRSTFTARAPELALVGVTMLWGASFLIIHIAMRHGGPMAFVGLRYLTAGAITLLLFPRIFRGLTRRELGVGAMLGLTIFLVSVSQTIGLQTISSSKSAFLTALYVPIVPFLQWTVLKQPPRLPTWAGITLAFVGLLLLTGFAGGSLSLGRGEIATLIGTMAIATEIILLGRFAGGVDSRRITAVQLLTAGLASCLVLLGRGEEMPALSWPWVLGGTGLALVSLFSQLVKNWAQKSVSPARATVIYAGEPVWGGIFGFAAGDRLPGSTILGAALIVIGAIVSELKPRDWAARRPKG